MLENYVSTEGYLICGTFLKVKIEHALRGVTGRKNNQVENQNARLGVSVGC